MQDAEIWKALKKLRFEVECMDLPEHREVVLGYNAKISPEARKLHDELVVMECCSGGWITNYDWVLENAGITAANLIVPDVVDPNAGAAIRNITHVHQTVNRCPDKLMLINKVEDIYTAKREGKVGLIIQAEHADFLLHRSITASVEVFAMVGLKILQLTYSYRNFAADGCFTGDNAGITTHGKELIRAMEGNGVTLNLSHVGERSTLEAMEYSTKPVLFTHSNPNKLFPHPRNISDEQIKRCAETGGVICAAAYPEFLWDGENLPTIDKLVDAVRYIVDLVGIDHVGIASNAQVQAASCDPYEMEDFNDIFPSCHGNTGTPPYLKAYREGLGIEAMDTRGFASVANFPNMTYKLLEAGFSKDEIKKIVGENIIRVYKDTWKN